MVDFTSLAVGGILVLGAFVITWFAGALKASRVANKNLIEANIALVESCKTFREQIIEVKTREQLMLTRPWMLTLSSETARQIVDLLRPYMPNPEGGETPVIH